MSSRIALFLQVALIVTFTASGFGQTSAAEIIQRSVEAIKRDWQAAPQFDCSERDSTSKGTKTYDDMMILGSPYQRLVAINGKPLSPAQAADEKAKLDNLVSQRQGESKDNRSQRIAKYEADQRRNHLMMKQLATAFNFTLQGETQLDGHDVYVLQAKPRPGYNPPNMETQALTGMQGKLWIDKESFEWVKVQAEVIHPVSIEGFLAQVEPGTRFELEKAPVAPGVWLPKHFSMHSRARILFLIPHQSQENDTFFNYRKSSPIQ